MESQFHFDEYPDEKALAGSMDNPKAAPWKRNGSSSQGFVKIEDLQDRDHLGGGQRFLNPEEALLAQEAGMSDDE